MLESLLARIASEVPGEVSPEILRIFGLYFCRIIDSDTFASWIRACAEEDQIEKLLDLKYFYDDSARSNDYWRAIHELRHYKRPPQAVVKRFAQQYNLLSEDLHALVQALRPGELQIIGRARTFLRGPYTDAEIKHVLDQVQKGREGIARRKLRYVADNDYSKDREDMSAELQAYAVRLIRRYEIEAESYEHMVRLVARGIINHGTNLAIRANRGTRKVLQRIVEQPKSREAWWFDTRTQSIRRVEVPKHKAKDRCVQPWVRCKKDEPKNSVCCEVRLQRDGTYTFAPVDHLYESQQEAIVAKAAHARGKDSSRPCLMDLAPPVQDDFIPTAVSIYKQIGDDDGKNPLTLLDVLPSGTTADNDAKDFLSALARNGDRLVRAWTDCVLLRDLFFVDYLREERGLDPSTLSEKRLGIEACKFLRVKMQDVKDSFAKLPRDLWTQEKARRIYL